MKDQEFCTKINAVEKSLMRMAKSLTKNYADAQDLYQEAIIKAYKNWETFREVENFEAFMKRVVYNTFISHYTKIKRRRDIFKMVTPESCPVLNIIDKNQVEAKLQFGEISAEINKLKEIYKLPLTMYANGYSYEEIASQLEIPIGTIKSRINSSRKQLERKMTILYGTTSRKAA